MRHVLFGFALVLAACGGPAKKLTTPPIVKVEPPPPPPFEVATSTSINALVTDATHLYWADDQGIYRRPLGPDQKSERLFAAGYVGHLAPGSTELFFVDGESRIRAVPLTGGQARDVDAPEDLPWALHAEADAVWYALGEQLIEITPSGRRTIDVPGAYPGPFTAADGAVFVIRTGEDDLYHLDRIDLASGKATEVSRADLLGEVQAMTLVGDELFVLTSDGAIAVPLDGGKPHRSFYGTPTGIAGDAAGYAVGGYGFVVTHARNQAPHLIASGSVADSVIALNAMAVAGEYVYYTSSDNQTGATTLRAAARAGGAILLRLPLDAAVSALGATSDALFAGIETGIGTALFQIGTRKAKPIAPTGWIEQVIADDQSILVVADGTLAGAERGGDLVAITEAPYTPIVLHKGKAYWGEGSIVRAAAIPSGEPFQVIDAATFDEAWLDQQVGGVAFANDHMYFVVNVGDRQGIAQVDEQRAISWLWTWTPGPDEYGTLDPNIVAVGDALFVHDGTFVFQVGADGTGQRVYGDPAQSEDNVTSMVGQLFAAGERLIAKVYAEGEELIEIPTDGGKPRSLWASSLDGGYLSYIAIAPNAVYVHVNELTAVVKIPLP